MIELTFTFTVAGLGAPGVAEDNSEALLEAFERSAPRAGAAVGADLERQTLGATFCAEGVSAGEALENAARIFTEAAIKADLQPTELVSVEVEPAADAESLPELVAA